MYSALDSGASGPGSSPDIVLRSLARHVTLSINGCQRIVVEYLANRPFPSSSLPSLQSESKCEVFVMVISSTLHMNEN